MKFAVTPARGYAMRRAPGAFGALASVQDSAVRPRPKTMVVLGSSNASGGGATGYIGNIPSPYTSEPPLSWVGRLRAALPGWSIYNRAVASNTTADLIARFWSDVAVYRPSHVILCSQLASEFYNVRSYMRGLKELVRLVESIGAIPVIRSPSPDNGASAAQYSAMIEAMRQIDQMGVWQIDALSTLDDGAGHFVGGGAFHSGDGFHPNDVGYGAMFTAVDLGMFTGGRRGPGHVRQQGTWKVDPVTSAGNAMLLDASTGLAQPLASFTMRARIGGVASGGATARGFMAAYINATPLRLRNPGSVYDLFGLGGEGNIVSTVNPTNSLAVRDCVITYQEPTNTVALYIDGVRIGTMSQSTHSPAYAFIWGSTTGVPANDYRFADCQLWSVPLSAERIADMARTGARPAGALVFDALMTGTPRTLAPNLVENGANASLLAPWLPAANY